MLWFKLGWRNIWRNRSRTMIQLLAIAGSLAFAIWMQNIADGSYEKMISDGVRMGSGHLSMHHPDYLEERRTELFFDLCPAISLIEGKTDVLAALPRLHVPALARSSRENSAATVIGVDFAIETTINPLLHKNKIIQGQLPETPDQAYIGSRLAETLKIGQGKKLVIMFQDFNGTITSKLFRISGIFKSGVTQIDNSTVFVDRKRFAATLGNENAAHELALILPNRQCMPPLYSLLKQTRPPGSVFEVFRWEETSRQLADTITMDHTQLKFMLFLLYVMVTVGTINLLLMSILERKREFGLLRAIGMEKSRIRKLIACEALILGITGSLAGFMAACIASFYSWYHGLDFSDMFGSQEVAGMLFEPKITSSWDWYSMFGLSIAMIVVVVLASIYPANKALRVNPAEAMRTY